LDALSSRLTVAEVAVVSAPPTRKNTSWITSGLPGAPAAGPGVPTDSRTGEFTGPASTSRPDSLTPVFGCTTMAGLPRLGTTVANPWPSTIVPGRGTTIGSQRVQTPVG